MKPIVRFTPLAKGSLLSIGEFIAEQDQDLETALQFIAKVETTCLKVAQFPHMGVARPELGREVRCFFVYDYVVMYVPEQEGITVLELVHSSRDVEEGYRGFFN
ncbi:MAG: type II toxin-antitoxin system RelE/ParE family toxin [Planctomycetota bacterium]